jgi:glucose dehydrogenase
MPGMRISAMMQAVLARIAELRKLSGDSSVNGDHSLHVRHAEHVVDAGVRRQARPLYVQLGNETPDCFGRDRNPASERYSSSITALDVETGRPRWSVQTVHHDLWDYDVPSQTALVDLPDGHGGTVPALLQTTKRGQLSLVNRATGEPWRQEA